jgi:hypothetical protein
MEDVKKSLENITRKTELERTRYTNKLLRQLGKLRLLYDEGKISTEEYNKIYNDSGFRYFLSLESSQFTEDFLYNRFRLIDIYERIGKLAKKYRTGIKNLDSQPVLNEEVIEFLRYANSLKLYETIKRRGMIVYSEKIQKTGVCISAGKLSYICIKTPYTRFFRPQEITLIHEMGHAYNYYCLDGEKRQLFQVNIASEIISILYEKLFFDFLKENGSVSQELLDSMVTSTETIFCKKAEALKKVLDYLDMENQETRINGLSLFYKKDNVEHKCNLTTQAYVIGDLASAKLFGEYQKDREYFISHLPEIIKDINRMSFGEVLDEYARIEPLKDYYDKHLVFKPNKKNA